MNCTTKKSFEDALHELYYLQRRATLAIAMGASLLTTLPAGLIIDAWQYEDRRDFKAAQAMDFFDCQKPLKGQTLPYHVYASFVWPTISGGLYGREFYGTVTITSAQKLDDVMPSEIQRYFNETPIRLTGTTNDGREVGYDTTWNLRSGRCPEFRNEL